MGSAPSRPFQAHLTLLRAREEWFQGSAALRRSPVHQPDRESGGLIGWRGSTPTNREPAHQERGHIPQSTVRIGG